MKANEVLRRYAAGERDFRRVNLRGQSFRGKDLSGADFSEADFSEADFSEADIRGTSFNKANLTGTKFCKAKAGLQKRWAIVLLLVSWITSGLSGIISLFGGALVKLTFSPRDEIEAVYGWIVLIVVIVLFAFI
ncbi:MAG: pentapeptide repeat-containing protein, partial [Moorea sp. SIO2B7]|nr:pentapeptide repeat-containing protein [Moorena sp. SIO2B7]